MGEPVTATVRIYPGSNDEEPEVLGSIMKLRNGRKVVSIGTMRITPTKSIHRWQSNHCSIMCELLTSVDAPDEDMYGREKCFDVTREILRNHEELNLEHIIESPAMLKTAMQWLYSEE